MNKLNSLFSIYATDGWKDISVKQIPNIYDYIQELRDNEGFDVFSKKWRNFWRQMHTKKLNIKAAELIRDKEQIGDSSSIIGARGKLNNE